MSIVRLLSASWLCFCVFALSGWTSALRADGLETLSPPPTLANRSILPNTMEVELTAEPGRLNLVPGKLTNAYAYNGMVPGPTLEVREGDRVIVHFKNNLPEPTTIHWHGLHVPVAADGDPMDPVQPGGSYDYIFDIQRGQAGTYWYHPHPHRNVGPQILRGLYGALIVHAADDPLPASLPQKLLILTDIRVNSRGSLITPPPGSEEMGWEGNLIFVNGQILPTLLIRSGEVQRWRVINASVSRFYRLALKDHALLQIGTDGGLFERPVPRSEILLAPSERAEILVQGTGAPGREVVLQSLPYDRYYRDLRPEQWDQPLDLLRLVYTDDVPVSALPIPDRLRTVPHLDPAKASKTQVFELSRDARINGQHFFPGRVDVTASLNTTEIWEIRNLDQMDHPFHLHGFSFQVLGRNGVPELYPAWKDTINVPKGQTVRFIVEYRDYPGRRMFHCHILDHEDYGMMGVLEVH
jgi:FtsP/CotA-like multicopper oxidase with cupredoxin domain